VGAAGTAASVDSALVLAAVLGPVVALATIADPRVGLGALPFAMVFSPEVGGDVFVRADDVVVGAVAAGWLARQAVHREPLHENPLLVPMAVLAAAGLAAVGLAVASGNVDPFTGQEAPLAVSVLHWLKRVEYLAIVFLVAQLLRNRREVAIFTGLLLAAGAILAARSVSEIATHAGEPGFRLDAPFDTGEANTLGEYLVFGIAIALGLVLTVRSVRVRLALLAVLALESYAFLYTFSRGAYVALLVVLLVVALLRDARLLLVVGALAFVLPSHLPTDVTARLRTIPHEVATLDTADIGSNALLARTDSYRVAARRVSDRPVLGYGPGVVALERIESQYAKEAVDGGVVGLAVFLWFLARVGGLARRVLASARKRFERGFGLGYLAGFAGMAVAGLGAIPFTTIRTMEAFCFATGLAIVLWRLQRREEGQVLAA
jgi:O-antigen ligase